MSLIMTNMAARAPQVIKPNKKLLDLSSTRRAASQARQSIDLTIKVKDPKILDLSGRFHHMQLPFSSSLQVLDLSDNLNIDLKYIFQFSIPTLQTLRINSCSVAEIPVAPPDYFATLRTLSLDANFITDVPDWIFTMPEITELSLFGNNIESINLPANDHLLKVLNLSMNPLSQISADPSFCVQVLNLSQTKLAHFPSDLCNSALKSLNLSKCFLTGEIDITVSPDLAALDLSFNNINSISDNFARSCVSLSSLYLNGNKLLFLPDTFPTPHKFSRLNFSNNFLEIIPKSLLNSSSLGYLNLSNNYIKNLDPFTFPQIRDFIISNNRLKELPDSFSTSSYLTTINVSFNELSDLPHSLTTCRKVAEANCSGNKFDHIPAAVLAFASIKSLTLSQNTLTTLPDSLAALLMLKNLDLSNNNLSGIPTFISMLADLRTLSFSHNRIKEIPNINFPKKLTSIDLSFNTIETVEIHPLPNLMNLSLQYNKIRTLNMNFADFPMLQFVSLAGNSELSGTFGCPTASFEIFNTKIQPPTLTASITTQNTRFSIAEQSARFGVGIASSLGGRATMEDSFCIISSSRKNNDEPNFVNSDMFIIFDGHAGCTSSYLLSDFMAKQQKLLIDSPTVPDTIVHTLIDANQMLQDKGVVDGSTVAGGIVIDNTVYIFGIGDSRVVRVCKSGEDQMTEDHKPTVFEEFARLKEDGFSISAENRVGRKLAVARSLGDFWCASEGLFVPPDISKFVFDDFDVGLIIACDGLWDVVTNKQAADVVRTAETATDAAISLKNLALSKGSADNVTIIVVIWKPNEGDVGISERNTVKELKPYVEEEVPIFTQPIRGRRRR